MGLKQTGESTNPSVSSDQANHSRGDGSAAETVTVPATESGTSKELRQATDQSHRASCPERRQIVLIHAILESRIADLVEAAELIEAIRASVGHQ